MPSIASITLAGGGAPAVITLTSWSKSLSSSGALASMFSTMGAPQKCVTFSSRISWKIGSARTARRQTATPALAAMVQGKHQPLQWNIGRVQR